MNFTDTDYDTHIYLDAIWRRRYILVFSLIIMPILAILSAYLLPQKYMASTSISININALPAMKDISTPNDVSDRFQGLKAYILAPETLQKIAIDGRLVKANEDKSVINGAADMLFKGLTINLLDKSVIEVQLILNKPDHMVDVLNLISQLLMQQYNSQEINTNQASLDVLNNAMQNQKTKLNAAIEILNKFETENSDLLPEYREMYQNQLRQINASLGQKQAEYSSLAAEKKELEQSILKINPIITEIDRAILENELKLSSLRLMYTDNYPDIQTLIQLNQSLKEARDKAIKEHRPMDSNRIQELWSMIIAQPGATGEKSNYQLLSFQLEKLINTHLKLTGMMEEIANLIQQQDSLNKKIGIMTDNKQKLVEIKQTIKDDQTAYENILSRINLAKMSLGLNLQERANLVKVVSYPKSPSHSLSRPISFFLFLGLLVGAFLGVGIPIIMELLDNTARTKRDIEEVTGFAVICRVERMILH